MSFRLQVRLDADGSGSTYSEFTVARYEYNPLHWRTVKVADFRAPSSNPTAAPTERQRRVMFYDASWRLIEEHICDDWDLSLGGDVNRIGQYFWGLRYIDDFIYRQEDRDLTNSDPGDDPEPDFITAETGAWYALTDVQFSVVALMTPEARIAERVVYDPYGRGRHYFPSDYNGDTVANVTDQNAHFSGWNADNLSGDWTRGNDCDVPDIFSFLTDFFAYLNKDAGAGQISFRYVPGTSAGPDNQIGYCGYVFNPETDDYTVRFRHYDPEIGRWLERDPAGYVEGNNLQQYTRSSAIGYQDPYGLYTESGHFYTTFLAAICAGRTASEAATLAYYSQLPDEIAQLDAFSLFKAWIGRKATGKRDAAADLWMMEVMDYLHSLHGGDIGARRDCLDKLLRSGTLSRWEMGLVIHAFGDSYAHVYIGKDQSGRSGEISYEAPFGHGFDDIKQSTCGVRSCPDDISNSRHRHRQYFQRLCSVLGGSWTRCAMCAANLPNVVGTTRAQEIAIFRQAAIDAGYPANGYDPDGGHVTDPERLKLGRGYFQSLIDKIKAACCPAGAVTCSPNPDPAPMRVPRAAGRGQETLDEANQAHARTDRCEAA